MCAGGTETALTRQALPVGDRGPAEGRHPRPRGARSSCRRPDVASSWASSTPSAPPSRTERSATASSSPSRLLAASASTARRSSRACVLELPERAHTAQFCDRTNDSSLMQKLYGQRDAGFFGCASSSPPAQLTDRLALHRRLRGRPGRVRPRPVRRRQHASDPGEALRRGRAVPVGRPAHLVPLRCVDVFGAA